MPGKVLKVPVAVGDMVGEGDTVLVLEALKMEIPVGAPCAGRVTEVSVSPGEQVTAGAVLMTVGEG